MPESSISWNGRADVAIEPGELDEKGGPQNGSRWPWNSVWRAWPMR
jgi:hypothetical protein